MCPTPYYCWEQHTNGLLNLTTLDTEDASSIVSLYRLGSQAYAVAWGPLMKHPHIAYVEKADIQAGAAIIHTIDRVLYPAKDVFPLFNNQSK